MEKTYIIGKKENCSFLDGIIKRNIKFLYPSFDEELNDFVVNQLSDLDIHDLVIFDLDSENRERICELAFHIRLTPEVPNGRYVPFLFTSFYSLKSFLGDLHSQILLTKGCSFCLNSEVEESLQHLHPLTEKEYEEEFIKRITIRPEGDGSSHSIANEWGAEALSKILPSEKKDIVSKIFSDKKKKLYFKYRKALSNLTDTSEPYKYKSLEEPIDIGDNKYLIIDDEAGQGWEGVLRAMINSTNVPVVFKQKVKNYKQLPKDIRTFFENDNINEVVDLVFLDLRMRGDEEEEVYNPRLFSGMNILKEIKRHNKGIQVIIFTASNKAWNLKALLDAGADGYYIKESPEYGFSDKFSEANSNALCDSIKRCIKRSYLKNIYSSIKQIEKAFNKNQKAKADKDYRDFLKEILNQIKLAFELENLTDPTDDSKEAKRKFASAYIALYQNIELINKKLVIQDAEGHWRLGDINGKYATGMKNDLSCHYSIMNIDTTKWKYPEWMKIMSLYCDFWNQNDDDFVKTIYDLIDKRNSFIHNDKDKLSTIHSDIYLPKAFISLFYSIERICCFL